TAGLVAYSAGGPMLSPFLTDPPPYVRCLVAFYTIMDIRQSEAHRQSETAETLERFSPIVQIARNPARVPPLFLAREVSTRSPGSLTPSIVSSPRPCSATSPWR